jgi:acyl-CoA reductase-like NAD-dependent aldehyde dehydrogenase
MSAVSVERRTGVKKLFANGLTAGLFFLPLTDELPANLIKFMQLIQFIIWHDLYKELAHRLDKLILPSYGLMSMGKVETSPAQEFLSRGPLASFIAGKSRGSSDAAIFNTYDPGSGEVLAEVYEASASDVDQAVAAAKQAFVGTGWSDLAPNERATYLHRLADLVEARKTEIADIESLDVGKPLPQEEWDVQNFCQTMRYYADLSVHSQYRSSISVPHHEARTVHLPRGVCAFIFPWNFPFLLLGWGIAPALAAGNTVVVKPAEETPLSTIYLAQLAQEAGIPAGVINVVTGSGEVTGAALSRHPNLARMSFTGSPEVGRMVARECGQNLVPVKLELGGKGAAVIFSDAEIDKTAEALVSAITLNSGQVCCTASRWVVQDKVYDQLVTAAIARMKQIRIGYGHDSDTQMGPVVSPKQRNRILGYLNKAKQQGAETLLEGGAATVPDKENGYYVRPAILAGPSSNVACREEIFGPVPFVLKFDDEDEAVALVNQSPYGLANSVWSRDLKRANRVAEKMIAGNSWINAHNVFVHGVPYGGVNLSGLGGGVLGPNTFFDYLRDLSVVRPL